MRCGDREIKTTRITERHFARLKVLEVREHQRVGDAEWLRVRTREGTEGWVFARLVGPAR